MGAGAKSEAIRLTAAAIEILGARADENPAGDDAVHNETVARVDRLLEHGISRRVDHRVRQRQLANNPWADLAVAAAEDAVAATPGMLVLLGSHPNGYIRQEAVRLATAALVEAAKTDPAPTDSGASSKVLPGVTRMLAQRALDSSPQVRSAASEAVRLLFVNELASDNTGRMPTNVERAGRELLAHVRCVVEWPGLVETALDLFDNRVGRYSNNGVRDHHRHNLREVDRRSQLLADLRKLRPTIEESVPQHAADRLIDFYERSMHPTQAAAS